MNLIIHFPPTTMHELTYALELVSDGKAFFETDLSLYTQPVNAQTETVISKIMQVYFKSLNQVENQNSIQSDILAFSEAFSKYKMTLPTPHAYYLADCIEDLLKNNESLNQESKEDLSIILITDVDHGCRGAMTSRALSGIIQKQTLIIPGALLIEILLGNKFESPNDTNARKTYMQAFREVTDGNWKLFLHKESDLIVLLPNCISPSSLQLNDYLATSIEFFDQETIKVIANIPYQRKKMTSNDIINTLDSKTKKNIIWAGHGNLEGMAMGISVQEVSEILNAPLPVVSWNLNSCFLLANMPKILEKVVSVRANIIFNDGLGQTTYHLNGTDSSEIYFKYLKHAETLTEKKVVALFEKLTPWLSGFLVSNHPFLILKGSHKMTPISFGGISENHDESRAQNTVYQEINRLFILQLYSKQPICLKGPITILSGTGERNCLHFFDEVQTSLNLNDFLSTLYPLNQDIHTLFLIKTLRSNGGRFSRVLYYFDPRISKPTVLFDFEKDLYFMDEVFNWCFFPFYNYSSELLIKQAIEASYPKNSTISIVDFFELVRNEFSFSNEFFYEKNDSFEVMCEETLSIRKEKSLSEVSLRLYPNDLNEYLRLAMNQDIEGLSQIKFKDMDEVNRVISFCIATDNAVVFEFLMNRFYSFLDMNDIMCHKLSAIWLNKKEILGTIVEFYESDLMIAACKTDLESFKLIWEKTDQNGIDIENLIFEACVSQNNDVASFLNDLLF